MLGFTLLPSRVSSAITGSIFLQYLILKELDITSPFKDRIHFLPECSAEHGLEFSYRAQKRPQFCFCSSLTVSGDSFGFQNRPYLLKQSKYR